MRTQEDFPGPEEIEEQTGQLKAFGCEDNQSKQSPNVEMGRHPRQVTSHRVPPTAKEAFPEVEAPTCIGTRKNAVKFAFEPDLSGRAMAEAVRRTAMSAVGAVWARGGHYQNSEFPDVSEDIEYPAGSDQEAHEHTDNRDETSLGNDPTRLSVDIVEAELVEATQLVYATPMEEPTADAGAANSNGFQLEARDTGSRRPRRYASLLLFLCIPLIAAVVLISFFLTKNKPDPPFLASLDPLVLNAIATPGSPQNKANSWMLKDPFLHTYSDDRKIQRFIFVSSYYACATGHPGKPEEMFNYSVPECFWYSVHPNKTICDANNILRTYNFSNTGLEGSIPMEMLLYSKARLIDISHNLLAGPLPTIGPNWAGVEVIDVSHNAFNGGFALEVGAQEMSLRVLKLQYNAIASTLPAVVLALMPNLTYVDITNNNYYGTIPNLFHMLAKLEVIKMANNSFSGEIGNSIARLQNLRIVDFAGNIGMKGTLPEELGQSTTLEYLDVRNTSIMGRIPSGLCDRASKGQLRIWVSGCGDNGWQKCC